MKSTGIALSRTRRGDDVAGEPHIRLRFFCSPLHEDSALFPVVAHLERAAGFWRDDATEQRLDKLEALLAQGSNDVGAVVPRLADLLAVPTGDRYPPLNMTPQKRKEQMLAALTAQVEGLSAREPVRREEQRSAPNNQVNIVTCGRPRHGGGTFGRKVMIANTRRTERRSTSKSRDSRVVGSLHDVLVQPSTTVKRD